MLVLFTSKAAVTHLTTVAQVLAAFQSGAAFPVGVPSKDFHCSIVSAAAYARGTPAPTVVGPWADGPQEPVKHENIYRDAGFTR